jgi:hypothetical protein
MEASIIISSNRAAYLLGKHLNIKIEKGDLISCDSVVVAIQLTQLECCKKILLNEIIDVYTHEQFSDYYKNHPELDIEKGRRLIREINEEWNTGKWQEEELEFDRRCEIIKRRIEIIKNIC